MESQFRPSAGQVVLLQYDEAADRRTATGLVIQSRDGGVVLDLSPSARPPGDGCEVVASVFAPEALYRAHATAHVNDPGRISLDALHDVERVQRRSWPRRPLNIEVSLVPLDEADVIAVPGQTVDLGIGGARVRTARPIPAGIDPSLALNLPDGTAMLLAARVVYADVGEGGCDYRLAFCDLEEADAARLAGLVGSPAPA